jgi:hypothetical protein
MMAVIGDAHPIPSVRRVIRAQDGPCRTTALNGVFIENRGQKPEALRQSLSPFADDSIIRIGKACSCAFGGVSIWR